MKEPSPLSTSHIDKLKFVGQESCSPRTLLLSLSWWLALLIAGRTKISERFRFQNELGGDRPGILAAVKTDTGSRSFKQHCHGHDRLFQGRKTQVPGIAAKLISHDNLFVLADDFALEVLLDNHSLFWLAGFGVYHGHGFLRSSGFATAANARGFDRRHGTGGRASFRHHIHDPA